MMTPQKLEQKLQEAADAVEEFFGSQDGRERLFLWVRDREKLLSTPRDREEALLLSRAAYRLSHDLRFFVLLPPRGPSSSTQDCPHCGNSIQITLSK